MKGLKKLERNAIEAVAKHFSATWENGSGSAGAYLRVAGKRIAVDIKILPRRGAQRNAAKPHLRFDRVATGLVERLRASLGETVPAGVTVLLTLTAPILLPAKTTASLEDKIRALLQRRPSRRDEKDTIHGNRVQIRLLRGGSRRAPKLIGFVHNPDPDPLLLLDMTHELLGLIRAVTGSRSRKLAGDRWLAVVSASSISWLPAYHSIYAQLRMETGFNKIVMVFADGRVGTLTY